MACRITLISAFTYRGVQEEYSNTYRLTGDTPADPTAWEEVVDALIAEQVKVIPNNAHISRAYCYDSFDEADDSVLTIEKDVPVNGTLDTLDGHPAPGDAAVWVRWTLDKLNSRGKKVYLRKYFHPAFIIDGSADVVLEEQRLQLLALGNVLHDGTFLDGREITDSDGTPVLAHSASTYATTRTLKRRGKRPPTG